jgi:hypothetical protein
VRSRSGCQWATRGGLFACLRFSFGCGRTEAKHDTTNDFCDELERGLGREGKGCNGGRG